MKRCAGPSQPSIAPVAPRTEPRPARRKSPHVTPPTRPGAPPGLGPHCVGQRVVVRRVLPGQTGPSGGPAMTDLLGVMESWAPPSTTVRAEDGTLTEIALAEIVSGKPVPPRPSTRMRVSAEQACLMSNASWPAVHTEPVGDWLLRAS